MGDNVSACHDAMDAVSESNQKPVARLTIPTPAELLCEPVVDYTNRIAVRIGEVVATLRASARAPVTVKDDLPVIQAVADAMRAAKWSASTSINRDGKTGRVTISVPKAVDPRLHK